MVKTLQNFSSQEPASQLPWNLVCCIRISSIIICPNDDPGFALTYFTPRSNLVIYAFVWEKVQIVNFSETFVACELKIVTCNQLNEQMRLHEYQRSRSVLVLRPRLLRYQNYYYFFFIFFFFFWKTAGQTEVKVYMKPTWDRRMKVYSNGIGHVTKMASTTIYGKNSSKIFLSRNDGPIALKLSL